MSRESYKCIHGNAQSACLACWAERGGPVYRKTPVEIEDEAGNRELICIHRIPIDAFCSKCNSLK